eukprot:3580210-Amphidinium_carterae.1
MLIRVLCVALEPNGVEYKTADHMKHKHTHEHTCTRGCYTVTNVTPPDSYDQEGHFFKGTAHGRIRIVRSLMPSHCDAQFVPPLPQVPDCVASPLKVDSANLESQSLRRHAQNKRNQIVGVFGNDVLLHSCLHDVPPCRRPADQDPTFR